MEKGKVKWFSMMKNYGFIVADSGKDLFFHGSDILEKEILKEDDEVEFEVESDFKGDKAVKVKKVEE